MKRRVLLCRVLLHEIGAVDRFVWSLGDQGIGVGCWMLLITDDIPTLISKTKNDGRRAALRGEVIDPSHPITTPHAETGTR
jgi:hypothetical protein